MAVEDEVRQASEQFYAALNSTLNGDPGPMMEVWSHGSDASAMHPFGSRSLGWEEVRASWEQAAQAISDGRVSDHQRGVDEEVVVPWVTMPHTPWAPNVAKRRSERSWYASIG